MPGKGRYNHGLKHWVKYCGEKIALPDACRDAGIKYISVIGYAGYHGVPMQMAFDHLVSKKVESATTEAQKFAISLKHKLPVKPYRSFAEEYPNVKLKKLREVRK
jgi:hypothetical protein